MTRSSPTRCSDDQGEGLLLNSYDRTLVIKQISSEDVADMHNILSEYHQVLTFKAAVCLQTKNVCGSASANSFQREVVEACLKSNQVLFRNFIFLPERDVVTINVCAVNGICMI